MKAEISEELMVKTLKRIVWCSDGCKVMSDFFRKTELTRAIKEISNFVTGVCFQTFLVLLIWQAIERGRI